MWQGFHRNETLGAILNFYLDDFYELIYLVTAFKIIIYNTNLSQSRITDRRNTKYERTTL